MDVVFKIEKWTSWDAVCVNGIYEPPKLPEIAAMQRRRFSFLSKMAMRVVLDLLPEPKTIRSVFSSRHGELHRTLELLLELNQQSALSPTKFSQSVYNTASGLYSISQQNAAPSTVVTSGRNSLAMAFVEAYGQSVRYQEPVLLVYVDEPLPKIYKRYADELQGMTAFACILEASKTGWNIQFKSDDNANKNPARNLLSQLLPALSSSVPHFSCQMDAQKWIWRQVDESEN
ncbi:beta-ketoacyl synthase chain length factor [Agarivorans sp. TSD2052]|uniref:beta-ketoacyl synthase chain length factor n=1 Tax=Agarivorans sp. TSD2052 TaxID=2937286 RepID=UPI0020103ACD|nr:beta-ketoacyl synthase chain length factor [Agarivorans sp. TSD2052]UPW19338.1 beta-ketoacyl synthase chain length factor [Agarivorans sp. TSD2052]